jgi:hypothetical protein
MINTEDNNNKNIFECERCGIIFLNVNLLEMHKEKFCIGPDFIQNNNNNRTNSPPIQSKYTETLNTISKNYNQKIDSDYSSTTNNSNRQPLSRISYGSDNISNTIKTQSAINQLKKYKSKKSVEQSLRDMEDTLIRDTIRDSKLATSFNNISPSPGYITSNQTGGRSFLNSSQYPVNDPIRHLLHEVRNQIFFNYFLSY